MGAVTICHLASIVLVAVCTRRNTVGPRGHSEISALLIPFACGTSGEGKDDTIKILYQEEDMRPGSWCLKAIEVNFDENRGEAEDLSVMINNTRIGLQSSESL